MKYLKTFEALKFEEFDEDDLYAEEVYLTDDRRLFMDYEDEFLTDAGFEYNNANKYYRYEDNKFEVVVQKVKENEQQYEVCYQCIINKKCDRYLNKIHDLKYKLDTINKEDRLEYLKSMMRKIYVCFNMDKRREREKLAKKLDLRPEGIKALDPYGEEEGEW